jgi:outer membrane protein assembly factor BamC
MSLKHFNLLVSLLLTLTIIGCSSTPSLDEVLPDRKVEYKHSKQADKDLEVPPDLTRSSIHDDFSIPGAGSASASYSEFLNQEQTGGSGMQVNGDVLPKMENMEVRREGEQRWLVIHAPPGAVWPKVVSFWQENGILLLEQDPSVGVILTDWLENRADIKDDFITSAISKIAGGLYSAATRDQYRVRLEPGDKPGTTELFLTHRGMEEQVIPGTGGGREQYVWVPRETDHGLEAEMLRRLMVYMGVSDKKASSSLARQGETQPSRSQLIRGRDQVSLQVNEDFGRAWRLAGVALDRVGFAVEDRDRDKGVYFVRYNDPMEHMEKPGLLSKLAFWRDDENIDKEHRYQVHLEQGQDTTTIVVLNEQGVRENSDTAVRILTLLHEQLR